MTSVKPGRVAIATMAAMLIGTLASAAQTPSLAEVARQEQERRKSIPPALKVLTNKDLPKVVAPPPVAAPVDAAKAEPTGTAPAGAATPEPDKSKDEAWWRGRVTAPREQVRRDEILLDALHGRVTALTAEFIGRDSFERQRIGDERQKAIAEMDRLGTEIVGLKKQIEDIEEEARRGSVPPGWLR